MAKHLLKVNVLMALSLPGRPPPSPDSSSLAQPTIVTARLAGPKQVTDFHLVNLAASNEVALATFDGSLARALHHDDRRHVHLLQG